MLVLWDVFCIHSAAGSGTPGFVHCSWGCGVRDHGGHHGAEDQLSSLTSWTSYQHFQVPIAATQFGLKKLSRRWQQSPQLHCRDGWLDTQLGFRVVHNTGSNSPSCLSPSWCTHVDHLAALVAHSPALGAVSHGLVAHKLSWPTSHLSAEWPSLF